MRQTEFCNHYRAEAEHATCKKGIAYDKFEGLSFDQNPCFERNGVAPCGCEFAEFPTAEERAERDRQFEIQFANIGKAREAIVSHLGPWKRGQESDYGAIDCPVCGGKTSLTFSRSGYNGHIHADCVTPGCVSWME